MWELGLFKAHPGVHVLLWVHTLAHDQFASYLVRLTGGGGSAPVPAPKPSDKSGLKEWLKKYLQANGRALANLAGKAAAALPGIIGLIVS